MEALIVTEMEAIRSGAIIPAPLSVFRFQLKQLGHIFKLRLLVLWSLKIFFFACVFSKIHPEILRFKKRYHNHCSMANAEWVRSSSAYSACSPQTLGSNSRWACQGQEPVAVCRSCVVTVCKALNLKSVPGWSLFSNK